MRRAFALIAVLASLWAATVWLLGGFVLSIGPLRVSSSDSVRPLGVALVATVIYVALAGSAAVREDAHRLLRALTPRRLALLLTVLIIVVGIANNSWAVGGSDSYSVRITDGSVAAGQPQRANQDRERGSMAERVGHLHAARIRRRRRRDRNRTDHPTWDFRC